MSAASDYLSQQMTLAASKAPIVTFVSCQRSLAPSAADMSGTGLATFGWGIAGQVHKDAAGKPDGLHFPQVHHWFSDRFTPSSSLHPPDLQYFTGGSGLPPHNNRDSLILTFTLDTIPLADIVNLRLVRQNRRPCVGPRVGLGEGPNRCCPQGRSF